MAHSLLNYLSRIKHFYRKERRMPTFREMASLFGFQSKHAVARVVDRLVKQKFIKKDESGHLLPGSSFQGVRLLGSVEAGFPSPAEEELIDTITIDEYLIHNHEATFLLRVSGDSMIEAGINPGDLVILERGRMPANGDIVVAEVDHQWTMKYYDKKKGRVSLIPANKKYPPIVPREQLYVAGVVVGVIRKYH